MSKIPKRCFHFDPDGATWGRLGCPRTSELCGFVHPDDPEWKDLPPTKPPRYIIDQSRRSPPPDHPRTNSVGRERSPPRYKTSPRYGRSDRRRTRSPSPRPTQSSRRAHDDDHDRHRRRLSRDYSHRRDTSRDEKPRVEAALIATPAQTPVSPKLPAFPSLVTPPMLLPSRSVPPTMLLASPSALSAPPPPTAPPPPQQPQPPLPPPPPLPTAPSFLSKQRVASPPRPTGEELRAMWSDRIKLLADCVQTRHQLTKVEEDTASCRRLMDTLRMPSLPDDDKQALSAELTKLESQRDDIKKSLDEKISRLTESNSWPIGPRDEAEEGELEKYQEMTKYVEELKNTAAEMNRVLNDIRERKSSEEHDHVTPMDVDLPEGTAHLPKRRPPSDAKHPPPATEEVDILRDKLLNLEERFAEFENDLNEHNQELMQEVKAYIEGKTDEIASAAKDAPNDSSGRYDQAQQEVTRMGNEVGELAGEIGALLLRANAQETELATTRREIENSKKDYATMEQRFQGYVEERERNRNAIEALKAALAAHVAHPPSPPRSPRIPAQDYVLNVIEEPLLDVVHSNVKPLIENLRAEIVDMLRNQNTEMYETLWGKLSLTLRLVETISGRIENGENA